MLSTETENWLHQHGLKLIAAALAIYGMWLTAQWWVRPPAVEFDNLRYVQLLSTALSARNDEWLRKVKVAVEQRHQAGEMSDRESRAFNQILATAADGDWKQAERDCFRLAEAQLNRRRAKPAKNDHDHEHDHAPRRELTRTP